MNRYFVLIAAFVLALPSCKKQQPDTTDPVVVMHTPGAGDVFLSLDTLSVHVEFSDDLGLHEIKVLIRANGTDVYEHKVDVDALSYTHHHDYVINVSDTTQYDVHAEAEDHAGNMSEVERHYHVMP